MPNEIVSTPSDPVSVRDRIRWMRQRAVHLERPTSVQIIRSTVGILVLYLGMLWIGDRAGIMSILFGLAAIPITALSVFLYRIAFHFVTARAGILQERLDKSRQETVQAQEHVKSVQTALALYQHAQFETYEMLKSLATKYDELLHRAVRNQNELNALADDYRAARTEHDGVRKRLAFEDGNRIALRPPQPTSVQIHSGFSTDHGMLRYEIKWHLDRVADVMHTYSPPRPWLHTEDLKTLLGWEGTIARPPVR